MEFIRGLHNLKPRHRGCVATIGNFDGVHLGLAVLQDRAPHVFGVRAGVFRPDGHLGVSRKIQSDEPDPRVGRRRSEFHTAGLAGVESHALERDRRGDRVLIG